MLDVEVLSKQALPGLYLTPWIDSFSDEFLDLCEGVQASCEVKYSVSSSAIKATGALAQETVCEQE